jgi:hypothetical protein
VLEYMRDGHVSVAEPGARPSLSLLHALKREFGFYCIELCAEAPVKPEHHEVAFVMGGRNHRIALSSMERYDAASDQWSTAAEMDTAHWMFAACAVAGEIYVTGGDDNNGSTLSSVERYSPSSDTWSAVVPLPEARSCHAAVTVGLAMYVFGGSTRVSTTTVLKLSSAEGGWSQVAPMPEPRRDSAACAVGSDIFVFGGCITHFDEQDSVFKYDTVSDTWSTLEPMPRGEYGHSASVLDGLIYIVGVLNNDGEVLRFDPVSEAWSTLYPIYYMLSARALRSPWWGTSFVLGDSMYAAGGNERGARVERYDVTNETWRTVVDLLEGRQFFCSVMVKFADLPEEEDLFDSLIARAILREP